MSLSAVARHNILKTVKQPDLPMLEQFVVDSRQSRRFIQQLRQARQSGFKIKQKDQVSTDSVLMLCKNHTHEIIDLFFHSKEHIIPGINRIKGPRDNSFLYYPDSDSSVDIDFCKTSMKYSLNIRHEMPEYYHHIRPDWCAHPLYKKLWEYLIFCYMRYRDKDSPVAHFEVNNVVFEKLKGHIRSHFMGRDFEVIFDKDIHNVVSELAGMNLHTEYIENLSSHALMGITRRWSFAERKFPSNVTVLPFAFL